jgi:hypothetical protein
MHRHLIPKFVGAVVLLTALGGGAAYAFTASNTVQASYAGQGTGTVSGYQVYNLDYTGIPASTPGGLVGTPIYVQDVLGQSQNAITTVSFQLSPDNARFVAVDMFDAYGNLIGGGGASSCTYAAGIAPAAGVWTCNVSGNDTNNGVIPPVANAGVDVQALSYIDVEAIQ